MKAILTALAAVLLLALPALAQQPAGQASPPNLTGTWKAGPFHLHHKTHGFVQNRDQAATLVVTEQQGRVFHGRVEWGGKAPGQGQRYTYNGGPLNPIRSFSVDSRNGRISMKTNVISRNTTNIPLAADAVKFSEVYFPLGVDITRTGAPFVGEHSRRIYGLGKVYKDVSPGQ